MVYHYIRNIMEDDDMPYEKGGRADKDGNGFEIRWIVYQLLDVLEEKIDSIIFEPIGDDEPGVDLWVEFNGHKEGQQCKGRNASKEYWDFSSIKEKGILKRWKTQLDRGKNYYVSLVSPLSFTFLEDLIKRAKTNDDPHNFYNHQILNSSKEFVGFFNSFCKEMSINIPNELNKSISYLKRIRYRQVPDTSLKESILSRIEYLFIGNSEKIYDSLISWIVEGEMQGKIIDITVIHSFLKRKKIYLKNLSNDERIFPRIQELNEEYNCGFPLINQQLINRDEFLQCRNIINSGKSLIIHGRAGRGKSSCTFDIINHCITNQIPYLAIKLDKRVPQKTASLWGKDLGLPSSIVHCINSISKNKQAVLILDQLDALRWTQGVSHESLMVCSEIIKQVINLNKERKCNISLVFVSRTYDLENDRTIKQILDINDLNGITWEKVEIVELNEETVISVVGKQYNNLTTKVKEVLKVPNNLYIWQQLDSKKETFDFSSTGKLISEWWQQLCQKCKSFNLSDTELNSIKMEIVNWLENNGKVFFPKKAFNISSQYLDYLVSNSFLICQGEKYSFAHQSILDYFIAEELLKRYWNEENIQKIIGKKENQTPRKRYQIQMFLEYLLEYNTEDFINVGQELFESKQIRFFLKHVFIEVLSQIDKIDKNIETFILEKCDDKFYEKHLLNSVFVSKKQFVNLLRNNGVLEKWFNEKNKKENVFYLISSIYREFSPEDISFIENKIFDSEEDDFRFINLLPFDICEDTDELFELRMRLFEKYPDKAEFYFGGENKFKIEETRIIRIVKFFLDNPKTTKVDRYTDAFESLFKFKFSEDTKILDSLLPYIPNQNDIGLINEWSAYSHSNYIPRRLCIHIIKETNKNIIASDPLQFWDYYKKFMGKGLYLFNEILLDGFINLPKSYSDSIIQYLIKDFNNNIFVKTDGSGNDLFLAREVIKVHSKSCNNILFNELKGKIIEYFPPDAIDIYKRRLERKNNIKEYYRPFHGDLQKELLEMLPFNRLSEQDVATIKALKRKFPNNTRYVRQNVFSWGSISSPKFKRELNDKQWEKILTNKKIPQERNYDNKEFVDYSRQGFSDSFENVVQEDPERYITLVIENKNDVFDEYIIALFRGVANSKKLKDVSSGFLEKMILSFEHKYKLSIASYICEIIKRRSDIQWSTEILNILVDLATNFQHTALNQDKELDTFEKILTKSLNCVYGYVSSAIGELISTNKDLFSFFKNSIVSLINGENIVVQFSALSILFPALNNDKEWATENILLLLESNNKFGGFFEIKDFLITLYPSYGEQVLSIILDLYNSEDKHVVKVGSAAICELYIRENKFVTIIENVNLMEKVQAETIFDMAKLYLKEDKFNSIAKKVILTIMVNRPDLNLSISSIFKNKYIDINRDKNFILEVTNLDLRERTVYSFVRYLQRENISLFECKDIIFAICYQLIENPKKYKNFYHLEDELYKLVVGLYDEVLGSQRDELKLVREECLKVWDLMFEKNIGTTRVLSREIMNL